jgi:acyl-CoA synthetase (AMP-forming)/AMP-acid ligase II
LVKGPGVLKAYHDNPEATARTVTHDGWLHTGDLVKREPFGLVRFAGRLKDVIKYGGYSVFPPEIEAVLTQHPEVVEAGVVGAPDPIKGEKPVAFVRRTEGATVDGETLLAWLAPQLTDYKRPVAVRFIDHMPRTGTNKIDKKALRALL